MKTWKKWILPGEDRSLELGFGVPTSTSCFTVLLPGYQDSITLLLPSLTWCVGLCRLWDPQPKQCLPFLSRRKPMKLDYNMVRSLEKLAVKSVNRAWSRLNGEHLGRNGGKMWWQWRHGHNEGGDVPVFVTRNAYKTQTHHNSLGTLNVMRTAVASVS